MQQNDRLVVVQDGVIDFAEFVVMVLAADRGISAATLMHEIIITTGRVQLRLEWHPTRPPQIKFTVTVFEARGLKKMDLIGDNDTYVLVTVDGVTLRTLTISGRTPSWEGEEGEEGEEGVEGQQLVFYVDALPDHFEVTAGSGLSRQWPQYLYAIPGMHVSRGFVRLCRLQLCHNIA